MLHHDQTISGGEELNASIDYIMASVMGSNIVDYYFISHQLVTYTLEAIYHIRGIFGGGFNLAVWRIT